MTPGRPVPRRRWLAQALAMCATGPALAAPPPGAAPVEFSPAERALFVEPHLAGLTPPLELGYAFRRRGSLDPELDDRVTLSLLPMAGGGCCSAEAHFLSGTEQLTLPAIEAAQGNPVILHFLERDVREMQRRTKGQSAYFRKRIRMAVFQGATLRDVSVPYRGATVRAREIEIAPYLDDPLRQRFESLAVKRYLFTLSPQVPGAVYAIATRVAAADPLAPPLVVEELLADGASSTADRLAHHRR